MVLNNPKAQGRFAPSRLEPVLAELGPLLDVTGFDRGVLASLRLKPAGTPRPRPSEPDRVEVTLVADGAAFAGLSAALDKLIGEYALTAHVRRV